MGKSTTAKMFAEAGVAVWDADAAVHRLYDKGGAAVQHIAQMRPQAVRAGAVCRAALRDWIAGDSGALARIESAVHPLVRADRDSFAQQATGDIVLFDIPLLFETGAEDEMDLTVTVSCAPEEQRRRVLERGAMDEATFDRILAAQMPDAEKRARADRVIRTDTLDHARTQVREILDEIRESRDA